MSKLSRIILVKIVHIFDPPVKETASFSIDQAMSKSCLIFFLFPNVFLVFFVSERCNVVSVSLINKVVAVMPM